MEVFVVPRSRLAEVGRVCGVWCEDELCGVLAPPGCWYDFGLGHGQVWGWSDPVSAASELLVDGRWLPGPVCWEDSACASLAGVSCRGFRWGLWWPVASGLVWGFPEYVPQDESESDDDTRYRLTIDETSLE